MRSRKLAPVAAGLTLLLAAAACTGDSTTDDTGAPAPVASGEALSLKGTCPDTVVIQTDWFPESEYGNLYQLLGPGYKIDKGKKLVRGPLVASGQDTGVQVEIRTGGPAIGFQQVSAQMYADKSITLGQVSTDEAVQNSAAQPTLAVVAPLEISPIMIMWNKDEYPSFNTIADIGQDNRAKILYYSTDAYMQYLLGAGLVRASQLDGSYDGAPTRWVQSQGKIAQGGFATSEPYIVANEIPGKKFPNTDLQLINDTGYPMYGQAMTIRPEDKEKLTPCLQKLVPILQQAQVDFITNPAETNKKVINIVTTYADFWQYSPGMADYAVKTMRDLGLVGNGPDKTLGNMQDERVKRMIDILTPIYSAQRKPVKEGLQPSDLFTNEFIDQSVGLDVAAR